MCTLCRKACDGEVRAMQHLSMSVRGVKEDLTEGYCWTPQWVWGRLLDRQQHYVFDPAAF